MGAIKMICKMVRKVLCRIYGYDIISKNLPIIAVYFPSVCHLT